LPRLARSPANTALQATDLFVGRDRMAIGLGEVSGSSVDDRSPEVIHWHSITGAAQPIQHSSPFRPIGRLLHSDPIEAAIVQPMQRFVENRRISGGIGRHLLRMLGWMRAREPKVGATATRGQRYAIYQEKWRDGAIVLLVQTG
jgi:hypothetical protein